jgi:uncharacterized membrane protein YkoI
MTTPEQKGFPLKRWLAAPLMVGALAGGYGLAAAQTDTPSTTDTTAAATGGTQAAAQDDSTSTTVAPADDGAGTPAPAAGAPSEPRRSRGDETALTGDTAEKVKAAALKAVPGATVDRVETDSDGSPYEAHLTKADGSHVTVKVNEAFEVTSIETDEGHGRHGPGHGGRGGPGGGETALTGETAEKVKAAALKAVPGGTVDRVETDSDGSPYEAHMTKADGSHVTVKVNEAFEVTSVEADTHGPRPGGDGQRPA